LNWLLE
jgi:V-type H+-transporting ATPase subunit H